jgi:hypothetical protein
VQWLKPSTLQPGGECDKKSGQCPLWVKSRHRHCKKQYLLPKGGWRTEPMSALGQKETSQRKRLPQLAAPTLFSHIPFICVETDEKALIFRLAIIFEVTAA